MFSALFLLFIIAPVKAQVLAPSAMEVAFSFQSSFLMEKFENLTPAEIAGIQASHVFGIFSSAEYIQSFGLDPDKVGGLGAPKKNMNIQILSTTPADGKIEVRYSSSGTFLFHKQVAQKLLKRGSLFLALPREPLNFYDQKCTDSHYSSVSDFWYFYNPFRKGCEYLYLAPAATPVQIQVKPGPIVSNKTSPRLDLLRAGNGNGSVFSIYVIHGYYESSRDPKDDGVRGFHDYNAFLRKMGFTEKTLRENTTWPLTIFTGSLSLKNGKTVDVEIRHALVESDAQSRNVYFAKFFKEAVENGDVVVYTGHSGLGSNLDIPYLESKAGAFKFPAGKRQIFFFESCSSYSYYLDYFRLQKTRATIDVVTNGLSSYFETSHDLLTMFTAHMLNPNGDNVTWLEILKDLESPLEGGSYLTNVGGL